MSCSGSSRALRSSGATGESARGPLVEGLEEFRSDRAIGQGDSDVGGHGSPRANNGIDERQRHQLQFAVPRIRRLTQALGVRIPEALRKNAPHPCRRPHLFPGGLRNGRRGAGPAQCGNRLATDAERIEEHDVDKGRGRTDSAFIDEGWIQANSLQTSDKPASLVEGIDDEDVEVSAFGDCGSDRFGPAEHQHLGIRRQQVDQVNRRGVFVDGIRREPRLLRWIGGHQHAGGKPPHRCGVSLSVDETSTRRHQSGRIATERRQRRSGFAHQHRGRVVARPGYITETLNGMHGHRLRRAAPVARANVAQRCHRGTVALAHLRWCGALRRVMADISAGQVPNASVRSLLSSRVHLWLVLRRLISPPVASNPPADLMFTPLTGKGFPLSGWLVQYHLLLVTLDPFTNESAWLLKTSAKILQTFDQADCRVGFVLAGADIDETRQFLGPYSREILAFPDPDRSITRAFGFERLPSIVVVDLGGNVVNSCEDWDPAGWQTVTDELARMMSWTGPVLPYNGDPGPYLGTPAAG